MTWISVLVSGNVFVYCVWLCVYAERVWVSAAVTVGSMVVWLSCVCVPEVNHNVAHTFTPTHDYILTLTADLPVTQIWTLMYACHSRTCTLAVHTHGTTPIRQSSLKPDRGAIWSSSGSAGTTVNKDSINNEGSSRNITPGSAAKDTVGESKSHCCVDCGTCK